MRITAQVTIVHHILILTDGLHSHVTKLKDKLTMDRRKCATIFRDKNNYRSLPQNLTVLLFGLFHQIQHAILTQYIALDGFVLFGMLVRFLFPPPIAAFRDGLYLERWKLEGT